MENMRPVDIKMRHIFANINGRFVCQDEDLTYMYTVHGHVQLYVHQAPGKYVHKGDCIKT